MYYSGGDVDSGGAMGEIEWRDQKGQRTHLKGHEDRIRK